MRPLGDRRTSVRLEVVGELWGSVELTEPAQVVNISRAGALIMSPVPMAQDSTGVVKLTIAGEELTLDARVRHFRHVPAAASHPDYYLIGLEFPLIPSELVADLD